MACFTIQVLPPINLFISSLNYPTLTPETLDPSMETSVADAAWRSRRLAALWVGLLVAIVLVLRIATYHPAVDPYLESVLSLSGDGSRGAAIFQMNCAVCHGQTARGEIGPSLVAVTDHRSRVSLIDQVISGKTPPMPQFQPDPQAMADLLQYLESL